MSEVTLEQCCQLLLTVFVSVSSRPWGWSALHVVRRCEEHPSSWHLGRVFCSIRTRTRTDHPGDIHRQVCGYWSNHKVSTAHGGSVSFQHFQGARGRPWPQHG